MKKQCEIYEYYIDDTNPMYTKITSQYLSFVILYIYKGGTLGWMECVVYNNYYCTIYKNIYNKLSIHALQVHVYVTNREHKNIKNPKIMVIEGLINILFKTLNASL